MDIPIWISIWVIGYPYGDLDMDIHMGHRISIWRSMWGYPYGDPCVDPHSGKLYSHSNGYGDPYGDSHPTATLVLTELCYEYVQGSA